MQNTYIECYNEEKFHGAWFRKQTNKEQEKTEYQDELSN